MSAAQFFCMGAWLCRIGIHAWFRQWDRWGSAVVCRRCIAVRPGTANPPETRHVASGPVWERAGGGCTCWVNPKPFTHYGVVEPGDALEPDPDCRMHFPWPSRGHGDPYCATHCRPGFKHSQCGCDCNHRDPEEES